MYAKYKLLVNIFLIHAKIEGQNPQPAMRMKIKKKVIESLRIRPDRGEALKNKAYELSIKAKVTISEADIVNFLIDTFAEKVNIEKDELKVGKD